MSKQGLFLAVYITDQVVQSSLWQVVAGRTQTLQTSNRLSFSDTEEALVKVDQSLQELGKASEGVDEVLFGLEPDWVDSDGVVLVRKPLLKKITEGLELKPLGFVDVCEVVFQHFVQAEPLYSAVMLEVHETHVWVQLILRGQLMGTHKVGRSADLVADINEGLARFESQLGSHKLPAQIVMYSGSLGLVELEKFQQTLMGHDWLAHQPFLHAPTIEVMPEEFVMDVLTEQGGRAVAGPEVNAVTPQAAVLPNPELVLADASEFGFTQVGAEQAVDEPEAQWQPGQVSTSEKIAAKSSGWFKKLKSVQMPIPKGLKLPKFDWQYDHGKPHLPIAAGLFGGCLVLLGMLWWYIATQAQVTLAVKISAKTLTKEVNLTLDPTITAPDATRLILPAQPATQSASGEVTVPATGVKQVGDAAKGKVTVINKTTSSKSFEAGTVLQAGKVKFVLDEAVNVASASVTQSGDSETKKYGKADAAATASVIGTEGNISKGSSLTIGVFDVSSFSAEATDNFTGGSSREVQVVSAADSKKARTDLTQQLQQKIDDDLKQINGNGTFYLQTGQVKLVNEKLNHKEGEEADQLTLTATLDSSVVSYRSEDMRPLAEAILKSELPTGYRLTDAEPQILSSPNPTQGNKSKVAIIANISAQAVPEVDWEEVKRQVAGRSLVQAESTVKQQPGVKQLMVTVKPPILTSLVKSLPKSLTQIELVTSNE